MSASLQVSYITNTGLKRKINEDSLLVGELVVNLQSYKNEQSIQELNSNHGYFMIVADGMGGHGKGEIASNIVVQTFLDNNFNINTQVDIENILYKAKENLDQYTKVHLKVLNFGTVIAGLYINSDKVIIFNCGDSRVYKYDGMFCNQLSHDHSKIQEFKDNGFESSISINSNIVTSALIGNQKKEDFQVYFKNISLKNNDIFLICSDGVWEAMTIEAIEKCLSMPQALNCIYDNVIASGAEDNFSAILLQVVSNE